MTDPFAKIGVFLVSWIGGSWLIWATFMAIKFITEVAQGQAASFSLHRPPHGLHAAYSQNVGAFILLPIFLTVIWTFICVLITATYE